MAGDEIGDHLKRHVVQIVAPRVEDAAGNGLVVGDMLFPAFVLLAAVELLVGGEHGLELADGLARHAAVVPGRTAKRRPAHAFEAAVEPVHDGKVGLAHPAVAERALYEIGQVAVLHDIGDHVGVVVQPDHVEVVEGILHAAPFTVLVEARAGDVQIAEASFLMRLAVPEIGGELFRVEVFKLLSGGDGLLLDLSSFCLVIGLFELPAESF